MVGGSSSGNSERWSLGTISTRVSETYAQTKPLPPLALSAQVVVRLGLHLRVLEA